MTAATQRYVGARTPFGVIVRVSNRLFNAEATVQAQDGSTSTYRLPFLIAHGARLAVGVRA
jgi:hypothetical protein